MARIPEEDIEYIKGQTDLVALIRSRGIELKKHGSRDFIGLCPFHKDGKTPNLVVSPHKGLYHCMACGAAGNPIQFIERFDGVSFRHAYELLANGGKAVFEQSGQRRKTNTIPKLPCPLDPEARDGELLGQVADYYHERLAQNQAALDYLASRGLDDEPLLERFNIGFCDRTLGLRIPQKNRKLGENLRSRLAELGVYRKHSGHEHMRGRLVVPIADASEAVCQFYGRRVDTRAPKNQRHLYLGRPLAGVLNAKALKVPEIILCESVIDALTFIRNGMEATTCTFGNEGFTEELFETIRAAKVEGVRIAYDADEAGERAAKRDSERLQSIGIEVWRIKFPWGQDANSYAIDQGADALRHAVRKAEWLGAGSAPKAVAVDNSNTRAIALSRIDPLWLRKIDPPESIVYRRSDQFSRHDAQAIDKVVRVNKWITKKYSLLRSDKLSQPAKCVFMRMNFYIYCHK